MKGDGFEDTDVLWREGVGLGEGVVFGQGWRLVDKGDGLGTEMVGKWILGM